MDVLAAVMQRIKQSDADFLKQVQQSKVMWTCQHHQNSYGDFYVRMLRHDPAMYGCTNKDCHKGHRCQIDNPLPPPKVKKAGRPACGAKTRAGGKCKAKVVHGKNRCRMHGGLSTGPKTQQGRAAIIASNKRRAYQNPQKMDIRPSKRNPKRDLNSQSRCYC